MSPATSGLPLQTADLPVGLFSVQPRSQKYSGFPKCKSGVYPLPSRPSQQGRFAIVTDVGRDAMDADALLTNSAEADGEVVWS
jgi:hypothetical protein